MTRVEAWHRIYWWAMPRERDVGLTREQEAFLDEPHDDLGLGKIPTLQDDEAIARAIRLFDLWNNEPELAESLVEFLADSWMTQARLAADRQDLDGMLRMAQVFYTGRGVQDATSRRYFELMSYGARKNSADCMAQLAQCYCEGTGVEANEDAAFSWARRAAEKNGRGAAVLLGIMYHEGIGCIPDFKRSFAWFKQAAMQEDPCGICNLGICLENGWGCKPDAVLANACFLRAAQKGWRDAMLHLAENCRTGRGCPQDEAQAGYWQAQANGA